jgi:hypothetical protein
MLEALKSHAKKYFKCLQVRVYKIKRERERESQVIFSLYAVRFLQILTLVAFTIKHMYSERERQRDVAS